MSELKLAARMAVMTESATLALNTRAKQLAAEGRTIYNLTAGELANDTPEYIQKFVSSKLNQNKYTPVAGLGELKMLIADHSRKFYGLEWVQPENIVVTGGAKPALHAVFMSLLQEGDEVIVPTPAWVSYINLIELTGATAVKVPLTEDFDLDIDPIVAAINERTKMILINSPHNPTGALFSKSKLEELAQKLSGTSIVVLADDIYSKLVFNNNYLPTPKAGFENLVIINGFSKSQALTGWRIGYLIASPQIASAAASLLSHAAGNAALPSQYAGIAALEVEDKPPKTTLDTLSHNRDLVLNGLTEAGIKHNQPGGAFYVFLDLRNVTNNSAEWCEKLLNETGVALVPGEAFSAPGFARLTSVVEQDVLKSALQKIKQFNGVSK